MSYVGFRYAVAVLVLQPDTCKALKSRHSCNQFEQIFLLNSDANVWYTQIRAELLDVEHQNWVYAIATAMKKFRVKRHYAKEKSIITLTRAMRASLRAEHY